MQNLYFVGIIGVQKVKISYCGCAMVIDKVKLKGLLKEKDITKSALADTLNISSRTIAKIGKNEDLSERVVGKIATFLGVEITALAVSNPILEALQEEMRLKTSGGIYHETQVKLTYNSNHMEGSTLTEEQTRYIFETKTIGALSPCVSVDDVIETKNHFRCIDYIISRALEPLSEQFILTLQKILKEGTEHADIYGAGVYKIKPNTVGGLETTAPNEVAQEVQKLINHYNGLKVVKFEDIVEFHYHFECIHPFQDGNGRIGRLIAFKQCLEKNVVPFYIDDNNKWYYYRGLKEWEKEPNYLIETCRFGQDQYKMILEYFGVKNV